MRWGHKRSSKAKQSCFPVLQKQRHRRMKKPNRIGCAYYLLLKLPKHQTLLQRSYLRVQCLLSNSLWYRLCYTGQKREEKRTKNFLFQGYLSCWPHMHLKEAGVGPHSLRFSLIPRALAIFPPQVVNSDSEQNASFLLILYPGKIA